MAKPTKIVIRRHGKNGLEIPKCTDIKWLGFYNRRDARLGGFLVEHGFFLERSKVLKENELILEVWNRYGERMYTYMEKEK